MPEPADLAVIEARFGESIAAKQALMETPYPSQVAELAGLAIGALREGGKVILFGNGGSAADATHLAAELVGRYLVERAPLAALSLTDNGSSVTAIGNDYAYEITFSRQLRGLGRPGDLAIGLSTSGTSKNVIEGLRAAGETGLRTAGICGAEGSTMAEVADLVIALPSTATARVQECTMLVGHTMCELIERALFPQ